MITVRKHLRYPSLTLFVLPGVKCTFSCFLHHYRSYSTYLTLAPPPWTKHTYKTSNPQRTLTKQPLTYPAHPHSPLSWSSPCTAGAWPASPHPPHLSPPVCMNRDPEVRVAAPVSAGFGPRLWDIGVPCWGVRRAKGKEDKKWLHTEDTPEQTTPIVLRGLQEGQA